VARPGGKEVGRVNIRAVPDSSGFRKDLKVMLDRVERTVKVSLPIEADTRPAEAALRKFQKDWNGQKVNLAAAITTGAAAASLRFLTRPRLATVIVRVQRASLVKARELLAAFSGARVAGDLVENLVKKIQNLDRSLPRTAFVATAIANATSVVLSALGGLLTVSGDIGRMFGLLAAAPGVLGGMAVGGLALGLALADVKKQLGVLGPEFRRLQDEVSANYWAQAREPILSFVRATLPEFRAGLAKTGEEVGRWSAKLVTSMQKALGGGRITAMFKPLLQSIRIASTGLTGFAQAFVVLGQVGGSYLPRLAQWVADLSNRFGAFLLQAEADGTLKDVIENGITAAKQFGSVLASISSILSGISDAGRAAGGGGLGALADVLARVAAIVNSEPFQSTLTTFFEGARLGVEGLTSALGPIGALLQTIAPVVSLILASTGTVIGEVLGKISTALSTPAFSTGLGAFFDGILAGITALLPAIPPLALAFSSFLGFAGALAAELGPVLGAVLQALAPVLITLLDALKPILPVLGGALISVVTALAPLVLQLAEAIVPLVEMIGEELGPVLEPLIAAFVALLPSIIQIAEIILSALLPALGPLLPLIAQIITVSLLPLGEVLKALMPIFEILGKTIGIVMTVLGGIISTVVALITGDFESIGKIWEDVWTGVSDFAVSIFNTINGLLEGFINGAIDLINGLSKNLQPFLDGLKLSTGGLININLGKIPHVRLPRLAIGADILPTVGGTALIAGEGGQAESVVNRGRTNRLIDLAAALASRALSAFGGGKGDSFTIVEAVSPDATAKAVARRRNRRKP
jgi:phage-related protein